MNLAALVFDCLSLLVLVCVCGSQTAAQYSSVGRSELYAKCLMSVFCGMVWCGMVWHGVAWCGVAWCGVALTLRSLENQGSVYLLEGVLWYVFLIVMCMKCFRSFQFDSSALV